MVPPGDTSKRSAAAGETPFVSAFGLSNGSEIARKMDVSYGYWV
jgi:hypothetical protein